MFSSQPLGTGTWLQKPLCWHGADAHSSKSTSQCVPDQPAAHSQRYGAATCGSSAMLVKRRRWVARAHAPLAGRSLRSVALHRGLHWALEFIHGGLELLIFNYIIVMDGAGVGGRAGGARRGHRGVGGAVDAGRPGRARLEQRALVDVDLAACSREPGRAVTAVAVRVLGPARVLSPDLWCGRILALHRRPLRGGWVKGE